MNGSSFDYFIYTVFRTLWCSSSLSRSCEQTPNHLVNNRLLSSEDHQNSTQNFRMTDPKATLPQAMGTEPDTSTLGTKISSLSITDDTSNSSSSRNPYQVFILAG